MEAKKTSIEKSLCDPQTHRDSAKIKELTIEFKTVENELVEAYSIWTDLSCRMERETSMKSV
jgi:hypothetical protein